MTITYCANVQKRKDKIGAIKDKDMQDLIAIIKYVLNNPGNLYKALAFLILPTTM